MMFYFEGLINLTYCILDIIEFELQFSSEKEYKIARGVLPKCLLDIYPTFRVLAKYSFYQARLALWLTELQF